MRKHCKGRGRLRECVAKKGMPAKLGKCFTIRKGVIVFPKGLCSREGMVRE